MRKAILGLTGGGTIMTLAAIDWRTVVFIAASLTVTFLAIGWILNKDERASRLAYLIEAWRSHGSSPVGSSANTKGNKGRSRRNSR
jgi:hypothetical protein